MNPSGSVSYLDIFVFIEKYVVKLKNLNLREIERIRICNTRISDPDPGGQLITDPSNPDPQRWFPFIRQNRANK